MQLPAQVQIPMQETTTPDFTVGPLDLTVIIVYLVASRIIPLWLGARAKKKSTKESSETESYFLGGRNFIWPFVGLSLVATNMSGATFVGLAGGAYNQGISIFAYEWMTTVILAVFIFFILPFYLRSGVFTLPEFLEKRFDRRSRMAFAGFNLFANMFIDMAAALFAGAIVVQTLYPEVPIWVAVAALAILAAIYTVVGGLGAVMISDSIQATVTILGGLIVFIATWRAIPSWDAVYETAGDDKMSLILPADNPDLPWPGLITGVLIIGLYYWTTNQLVVQRTLGARSLDHGRWGALMAGFIKLTFLFLFILPGVMALTLYDLDNPDTVFPTLVFDLLPAGLSGLIVAAVIAAITSTVDSILNSASTIVTMDFVKTFKPETTDRSLVLIGRIATVVALVVAIIWAPFIAQFDTLYNYLQSVLSYLVPPVVAVFLMGIGWKRVNATAAFLTLVILQPLGVIAFIFIEVNEVIELQFLYASGIGFATALIMLTVISIVGKTPDLEKTDELTWKRKYWKEETDTLRGTPVWANYRVLTGIMLAATVGLVVWFA
ncbi:sodium:solute symporter [Ornithinimicrobium sediminis]|uniref:sodium:solute symporter n=1 Tax=Ornithinimicrobium sediminis TaxID=2904603 RepID=UPI001E425F49|nr:sodium:solute symporter [Ornithinimicrobium sediminis]MCE0486086.1 sodium:solute symporter [Ornithinimicrobium sediminis]